MQRLFIAALGDTWLEGLLNELKKMRPGVLNETLLAGIHTETQRLLRHEQPEGETK